MIEGEGFRIRESKFDYFFGRVTSGLIKQTRSRQNLEDLERLGIQEQNDGREKLLRVFQEGLTAAEVKRLQDEYGVTISKRVYVESEGVRGDIVVSYLYRGGDLASIPEVTTLIPRIYQ
ncbi:hypothetical protein LEP3755_08340 [Leptolyngbya sp. NIES-3755]|nr:hypothetical protein LEP3755_08340 [Leptolyngbya sp. NIES-3755]